MQLLCSYCVVVCTYCALTMWPLYQGHAWRGDLRHRAPLVAPARDARGGSGDGAQIVWRWRGDGVEMAWRWCGCGRRHAIPRYLPPQVRLRQAMVLVYAALLGSSAAPDLLELASQVLGYCCLAK